MFCFVENGFLLDEIVGALNYRRAQRFKYLSAFWFVSIGGSWVWLAWWELDTAVDNCLGVRNQGVEVKSVGCEIVKAVPQPRFSTIGYCQGGKEPKCGITTIFKIDSYNHRREEARRILEKASVKK